MATNRILLIDNQPLVLSAIAHYLGERGYEIHTATDGRSGVARIEEIQPDLVITEVTIPVMDGWALVQALRANPRYGLLPIILLTDQDTAENRIRGYRLGADDFVAKTTLVEELEVRIARALERAAAIAEAIGHPTAVSGGDVAAPAAVPVLATPAVRLDLPPLAQAISRPARPGPAPVSTPRPARPPAAPMAGLPGIQGSLGDISLAAVVTMLSASEQSGVLTLSDKPGDRKARLLIRSGQLLKIGVEDGRDLPPVEALARLMTWREAMFSFTRQDVTAHDEIHTATEHLLMEASQFLDEGAT